jgi:hypothetical protein
MGVGQLIVEQGVESSPVLFVYASTTISLRVFDARKIRHAAMVGVVGSRRRLA